MDELEAKIRSKKEKPDEIVYLLRLLDKSREEYKILLGQMSELRLYGFSTNNRKLN